MTVEDAIEEFSNDRLADLASAVRTGTIPDDQVTRLRELLEDADPVMLNVRGMEKPALGDLIQAVDADLGIEIVGDVDDPGVALDPEAREAVERVEDLLEPGAGRDPEFFREIREALTMGDAGPSPVLTQDTIDLIPPEERDRLAERADDLIEGALLADASMADFPTIQNRTERGPGRTVQYFRQVLAELRGERDPETLPAEELERLQRARGVLDEFVGKVRRNIEQLEGGSPQQQQPGVNVDVSQQISSRARSIVPNSRQREDPITGESFEADPGLERAFLEWVIDQRGEVPSKFDQLYFRRAPENRDITMQAWARLEVKRGAATVDDATSAGLPGEWFEGL